MTPEEKKIYEEAVARAKKEQAEQRKQQQDQKPK